MIKKEGKKRKTKTGNGSFVRVKDHTRTQPNNWEERQEQLRENVRAKILEAVFFEREAVVTNSLLEEIDFDMCLKLRLIDYTVYMETEYDNNDDLIDHVYYKQKVGSSRRKDVSKMSLKELNILIAELETCHLATILIDSNGDLDSLKDDLRSLQR